MAHDVSVHVLNRTRHLDGRTVGAARFHVAGARRKGIIHFGGGRILLARLPLTGFGGYLIAGIDSIQCSGYRPDLGGNLYQNIAGGVVSPHKVKFGVRDGRIASGRIAGDVERMIVALDDRKTGLVNRIEHRSGNLADAAAQTVYHLAVQV